MTTTNQIAKHLKEVYFGGNWTGSNLADVLAGVTWEEATTKVYTFNTIVALTYHTSYYVTALLEVLHGRPLNAKDEYSFNHPPIQSAQDWEQLLSKIWDDAKEAIKLIENLPDEKLSEVFTNEKYGNYYRNIQGTIEHMHYHLGQMVLIKKILLANKVTS